MAKSNRFECRLDDREASLLEVLKEHYDCDGASVVRRLIREAGARRETALVDMKYRQLSHVMSGFVEELLSLYQVKHVLAFGSIDQTATVPNRNFPVSPTYVKSKFADFGVAHVFGFDHGLELEQTKEIAAHFDERFCMRQERWGS